MTASLKRQKLTKTYVESLPLAGMGQNTYFRFCAELPGFGVKVTTKSRIYVAEGRVHGRLVRVKIGRHDSGIITTEEARRRAKEYLGQMAQSISPNEKKAQEKAAQKEKKTLATLTLKKAFQDYLDTRKLKANTAKDYANKFNRCFEDWLDKPLRSITKDMILARHKQLSKVSRANRPDWTGQAQANYGMRILRSLYEFAAATYDAANGQPIITNNPVKHLTRVNAWNSIESRPDFIKPHKLRPWYQALKTYKGRDTDTMQDYLLLCLFTGLRRNEAASLRWDNIDFQANTLLVEDTKNKCPHLLPLSDFVRQMLFKRWQARKTIHPYVFPAFNKKPGHIQEPKAAIAHIQRETGIEFRVHDLRRTFASIAAGQDISSYTIKKLLNHSTKSDVTAGYAIIAPERLRKAMQQITDFILRKFEEEDKEEESQVVATVLVTTNSG